MRAEDAADLLSELIAYVPEASRESTHQLLTRLEQHEQLPWNEISAGLREATEAAWPARQSVERFLTTPEGQAVEWITLLEHVRPVTALLLERLRELSADTSLQQALSSEHAAILIHPSQKTEIALLLPEIHIKIWNTHLAGARPSTPA